jgi:Terpene cyclase DEP1
MSPSAAAPAANNNNPLAWLYLTLAIAGAVLTWQANLAFMQAHGTAFDLGLFVRLANANPAAQSLSRDLAVAATAFTVWMVAESRRLTMKGLPWVLLICVTIAFACGGPLFLYLRERRLMEMARINDSLP